MSAVLVEILAQAHHLIEKMKREVVRLPHSAIFRSLLCAGPFTRLLNYTRLSVS
jgi:hypothetical protein